MASTPHDFVNYDESKVLPYSLEDPLVFADGRKVASPAEWQARRREILDIFASKMYGREPPPPEALQVELVEEGTEFAGFAIRRQYRIRFRADGTGPYLDWLVLIPNRVQGNVAIAGDDGRTTCENKGKVPVILFLNYRGNHALLSSPEVIIPANVWSHAEQSRQDGTYSLRPEMRGAERNTSFRYTFPIEVMLARGYAVMSCCYCQVSPDVEVRNGDPLDLAWTGVFDLWKDQPTDAPDRITTLGAWAWALSRGLDLAERIPEIDATRAVATGCSRLGKTALIAGARDERFAVTVPNQTGGGGAPLNKRFFGETIATEQFSFPHWFCPAYFEYAGKEAELPFDQHLFLSCLAPRGLLVEGFDMDWFDTKGEFLACRAASPVWKFLGAPGLPAADFPENYSTAAIGKRLGYVRRGGQHGLSAYDWLWMMDFADGVFASR